MLPLNVKRKPFTESPIAQSYLTLSDLEGQSQGYQDSEVLYLVNEPK